MIREALRALAAKGLIDSRPEADAGPAARRPGPAGPELLGWMFEGAPPLGFVRTLFEFRQVIEAAARQHASVE